MKTSMVITIAAVWLITSASVLVHAACEPRVTQASYIDYFHERLQGEICGICKEPRADIFWINPHSQGAHRECYQLILPALKTAYQKLNTSLTTNPENNDAHHKFIRLIQEAIGIKTILESAQKDGIKCLEEICNSCIDEAIQHIRDNKSPWE